MTTLLQMSVSGALMVVAVALVRLAALHRLPKRLFVALWLLVALRLLVPLWIPAPTSAFNLLPAGWEDGAAASGPATGTSGADGAASAVESANTATDVASVATADAPEGTRVAGAEPENPPSTAVTAGAAASRHEPASSGPSGSAALSDAAAAVEAGNGGSASDAAPDAARGAIPLGRVVPIVWAVGAAGCGAFFAASYAWQRRRFGDALPVDDPAGRRLADGLVAGCGLRRRVRVRQSDRVATPLTYGTVRPVVLMPADFAWRDADAARYVLVHELTHIRRFDGILKLVLAIAACIHWFNPFAWAMYALANRDIELSCDEAVVRSCGISSRGAYARTLLAMGEREGGLVPLLQSGFGKTALEERIGAIMRIRRTSLAAAAASLALVVAIPAALATSAVEEPAAQTGSESGATDTQPVSPESTASDGDAPEAIDSDNYAVPVSDGSSTAYFATFGGTTSLSDANPARPDDLLAAYSDEEWEMLADFLREACGTFVPMEAGASAEAALGHSGTGDMGHPHTGKLSVAEFRLAALEAFGSTEGQALLDKLAADTDLAAYMQGVTYLSAADGAPALDDDVAVATLAYHLLVPLVSDDWDNHAFEGSVALADGSAASFAITVRVDDAELVSANEYAYTAAWVEQSVRHAAEAVSNPDNAYAAGGLTAAELAKVASAMADRRTPAFGLVVDLSLAYPSDGQGALDSRQAASATYALATGPLTLGGTGTDTTHRGAGERFARSLAAMRLFSRYEQFGLTLSTVVIADYVNTDALDGIVRGADGTEYSLPIGQSAYQIHLDGTPVARVYDPACRDIVSSWFGLVGVVADSVDVVIERDSDGAITGARIAEAGEVDELMRLRKIG